MKSVLFHRRFDCYSGGQQKVYDYFQHFRSHAAYTPFLYLAPESMSVGETLWRDEALSIVSHYAPREHDLAFVAGMDWEAYLANTAGTDQVVINLIQHVRHADPNANVHPFLSERAVRICVSPEVEEAILATGRVNGPSFAISNGVSVTEREATEPGNDVFILGYKQPALARALRDALEAHGYSVIVNDRFGPRDDVLDAMRASRVRVLLPHETEGFYLPALESMRFSGVTIVPDCVGNRSFCHHQVNCLMPDFTVESLSGTCRAGLALFARSGAVEFDEACRKTLTMHTIERERSRFCSILDDLDQIW